MKVKIKIVRGFLHSPPPTGSSRRALSNRTGRTSNGRKCSLPVAKHPSQQAYLKITPNAPLVSQYWQVRASKDFGKMSIIMQFTHRMLSLSKYRKSWIQWVCPILNIWEWSKERGQGGAFRYSCGPLNETSMFVSELTVLSVSDSLVCWIDYVRRATTLFNRTFLPRLWLPWFPHNSLVPNLPRATGQTIPNLFLVLNIFCFAVSSLHLTANHGEMRRPPDPSVHCALPIRRI